MASLFSWHIISFSANLQRILNFHIHMDIRLGINDATLVLSCFLPEYKYIYSVIFDQGNKCITCIVIHCVEEQFNPVILQ